MPQKRLRQPWLHELVSTVQAPTVVLSGADGQLRGSGAEGILHADTRVLSRAIIRLSSATSAAQLDDVLSDGAVPTDDDEATEPEPIAGGLLTASSARFSSVPRQLGDDLPDPTVRLDRIREVEAGLVREQLQLTSRSTERVSAYVLMDISADLARVEQIKSGRVGVDTAMHATQRTDGVTMRWGDDVVTVELTAPGARLMAGPSDQPSHTVCWLVTLEPGQQSLLEWSLTAVAAQAPIIGVAGRHWDQVSVRSDDHRLPALTAQSLTDLAALVMAPVDAPTDLFLAAGSPWFFTLFGRDSIWAARLLLPFGSQYAAGTLRALAARQGSKVDVNSAEQPGKIPHELRQAAAVHEGGHGLGAPMLLPPLYYGTIDATPLWICLLHDAWKWGMPTDEVRALVPALLAALNWLRDYGDADGDGFLEYLDESGRGLANQGWKDSGDSVRFLDGRIADGPVALCEVQGYAYEAAMHGAALLDAFGEPGADGWRDWANKLSDRFREAFWVEHPQGRYPALALDGGKQPVDSLTSNIGHLLATGILNDEEADQVARHLSGPRLSSGFGLRTMSSDAGGYSPLSYHCGSVWPHDTAIAIHGLTVSGHVEHALVLIEGLLAAGVSFDFRLPELFSGDDRSAAPWPAPYPASCRPQAWAAASVGAVLSALIGINVDAPAGEYCLSPVGDSPIGAMTIDGLRVGEERFTVDIDRDGAAHSSLQSLQQRPSS